MSTIEFETSKEVQAVKQGDLPSLFFARFGTAFLSIPDSLEVSPENLQKKLAEKLAADSRVAEVLPYSDSHVWSRTVRIYPGDTHCPHCLVTGADAMDVLKLGEPLLFKLRVPIKNQPIKYEENDVPTEEYWAAWNGMSLAVVWESPDGGSHIPTSAGHIAYEVLSEVAKTAGFALQEQPCEPGCQNQFIHCGFILHSGFEGEESVVMGGKQGLVHYYIPGLNDPVSALEFLVQDLFQAGAHFAEFKSSATRVFDIEEHAQALVSQLLMLDSADARVQVGRWYQRRWISVKNFFTAKAIRDKRSAKRRQASLWLAMASVQLLMRGAAESKYYLDKEILNDDLQDVFVTDLERDYSSLERVNLEFIKAAVEQRAARQDSRVVAIASIVGASVGAGVGLLGGQLFGG